MTAIVPFGKYKGRDVIELMESDPGYLQWLTGQDWFRAKFVTLHQTIINRGAEAEETPDHNALQVMFLDDGFCQRFCYVVTTENNIKYLLEKHRKEHLAWALKALADAASAHERVVKQLAAHVASEHTAKANLQQRCEEQKIHHQTLKRELPQTLRQLEQEFARNHYTGWNLGVKKQQAEESVTYAAHTLGWMTTDLASYDQTFADRKQKYLEEHDEAKAEYERLANNRDLLAKPITTLHFEFKRAFEQRGIDVRLTADIWSADHPAYVMDAYRLHDYIIEIKPTVGDDYPAVLRQMRRNESHILLLERYTGQGATRQQFISTFATAGIRVVFLEQCEPTRESLLS